MILSEARSVYQVITSWSVTQLNSLSLQWSTVIQNKQKNMNVTIRFNMEEKFFSYLMTKYKEKTDVTACVFENPQMSRW